MRPRLLWGRSVLPTTVQGRPELLCTVLFPVPFFIGGTMFGASIFVVLGVRKGDRGLLLVLHLLVVPAGSRRMTGAVQVA